VCLQRIAASSTVVIWYMVLFRQKTTDRPITITHSFSMWPFGCLAERYMRVEREGQVSRAPVSLDRYRGVSLFYKERLFLLAGKCCMVGNRKKAG
jgi:hypothetical protein